MKYLMSGIFLLLVGCSFLHIPEAYQYKEIQTASYKIASWQKITDKTASVRIYIEGDGHAFNYAGLPTSNPTPKGTFLRDLAFNDPNPNVVYLARPCQFVKDAVCGQVDWTIGRFSQKIIDATAEAIQTILKDQKAILIGYSGGAFLSGLVIHQNPDIKVQKWVTIAGLLNHTAWTKKLNLPPLTESVELETLPQVPQKHYVGEKDVVIPKELSQSIVPAPQLRIIQKAGHDTGYEVVYNEIYE